MLTPGKGTKNDVTIPPQWDGFFVVLNAQIQNFLSLNGVENPRRVELYGSSRSKIKIKSDQSMTMTKRSNFYHDKRIKGRE